MEALRHLDKNGRPICGTPAAGALVVDEPVHVTCIGCLLWVSMQLAAHMLKPTGRKP